MNQRSALAPSELWHQVDNYTADLLQLEDPALHDTLEASKEAGLPSINVSPPQGKFLMILAKLQRARRILEIGTLGGYSTIWLARALPAGGRLITLEVEPRHAEVARANIARADLSALIDLRVGKALDLLPQLVSEGVPFDFIFIDADKPNTSAYFEWALKLSRAGSVIVVDNVVRNGALIDAASTDVHVQGMRRFLEQLGSERRADATVMQTVGVKGYDGFAIAIVTAS